MILKTFEKDKRWYIEQNKNKSTFWAEAARRGFNIYWELFKAPENGRRLLYTGRILINGKLTYKEDARRIIEGGRYETVACNQDRG